MFVLSVVAVQFVLFRAAHVLFHFGVASVEMLVIDSCFGKGNVICAAVQGGIFELFGVVFPKANGTNIVGAFLFLKREISAARTAVFFRFVFLFDKRQHGYHHTAYKIAQKRYKAIPYHRPRHFTADKHIKYVGERIVKTAIHEHEYGEHDAYRCRQMFFMRVLAQKHGKPNKDTAQNPRTKRVQYPTVFAQFACHNIIRRLRKGYVGIVHEHRRKGNPQNVKEQADGQRPKVFYAHR